MNHPNKLSSSLLAFCKPLNECGRTFRVETKSGVDNDIVLASHLNRALGIVQIFVQLWFDTVSVCLVEFGYAVLTSHKARDGRVLECRVV